MTRVGSGGTSGILSEGHAAKAGAERERRDAVPWGRAGRAAGASLSRWAAGKAGEAMGGRAGHLHRQVRGSAAAPSGLRPRKGAWSGHASGSLGGGRTGGIQTT